MTSEELQMKIEIAPMKQELTAQCNQMIARGQRPVAVFAALLETAGSFGINSVGREVTGQFFKEMARQTKRVQIVG